MNKMIQKLENNKGFLKSLSKVNNQYYLTEDFCNDVSKYIKSIKENRMVCFIDSVSRSGMNRKMRFVSCEKNTYHKNTYNYRQFSLMFKALGFTVTNEGLLSISGCGMDMVFHTNYTAIRSIYNLGLISKKECDLLSQKTPSRF